MVLKKDGLDEELLGGLGENVLPPENIVVLNELRSASDLNRLMQDDESIDIHPDFQRDEVWSPETRARFIDSMSKEFPIPSMCFAMDPKSQRYIVIDGLQRMSTIKRFLSNPEWTLPKLSDIDARLSGKSVAEIKKSAPEIYRRIENLSLPVTILRYDPIRGDNMEYIFTIFQRLNTFGDKLNNQEIRNAIYQGSFNTFLKQCAEDSAWSSIAKPQRRGRSSRMIAEEKLLRFFAFYDNWKKYTGKYNMFLNDYMQERRFETDLDDKAQLLTDVLAVIKRMGQDQLGKSNAFIDAVLHGIAKNINNLKGIPASELKAMLRKIKENEKFTPESLQEGTMQKTKVHDRLTAAEKIFAGK